MSKVVKKSDSPPTNSSLADTRPSARQLASTFSRFDPRQYLNRYRRTKDLQESALLEEANTELQDPEGTLHDPIKDNDRLTALGALLVANFEGLRRSSKYRPIVYGIGCLLALFIVGVCGGAILFLQLLSR